MLIKFIKGGKLGEGIKLGLVGIGGMGSLHLKSMLSCKDVELVALCDINKKLLEEKTRELKVPGFSDLKEMLEKVKMDAIVIVLPHWLHLWAVKLAAEKGLDILKEKPLARNLKEAKEIAKIVKENGITLMIGTQRRYAYTFSYAKRLLNEGLIGEPFLVRTQYVFCIKDPDWRGIKEKAGGGVLLDAGYHPVDLVYWYVGFPKEVYCKVANAAGYETEDTALITYTFDNIFGYSLICWVSLPKEERVIIHGSKGSLVASWSELLLINSDGKVVLNINAKGDLWIEALRNQLEHFIECVRYGKTPLSNVEENLKVMEIIDACYRSALAGRVVRLSPK